MSPPRQLDLTCGTYRVVVSDADRSTTPADYSTAHYLDGEKYQASSCHRVTVIEDGQDVQACLLIGGGGTSGVHAHSAVCIGGRCYVAVGDSVCALSVPGLDLVWRSRVDSLTCFGVHYLPEFQCFISHGELEIARFDLNGKVTWQTSGRDIFSEGFAIHGEVIEATDFYKTTYRIDIETGRIVAEMPSAQGA
ncbi:Uncharacterized protein OS=Burkholderia sp. MSh2 GN=GQ57_25150 PE=4 SV=1 [Gemmata massiliana]|uniref:Uncharacterized protein n=1 Tax=Gemmata massiliana TaxID=1210884 RepID=A0A6P2CZ88_9BACT|nr:hypothetical protein [Gemmata massiliana]VTR93114.1 Uncharacterized protein OS=Burkholderia sp. MSh2 GN=GQ57_25150 PE=4 SV=1 [Gemmata massiliana]